MTELLKLFPEIAKTGILTTVLVFIIIIVYLQNRNEKEQLQMRKEELKTYSDINNRLIDKIEMLTIEVSKSNQSIIEMISKNDLSSKFNSEGIMEIKEQVKAIHERVNEISKNQTEIRMIVSKCNQA